MTDANFEGSLRRVLIHEGGFCNDKDDPGGSTLWGVTHADYDAYRRRKGLQVQSVRAMSRDEMREIYRQKYWIGARCAELPSGVDYAVFDGAVNSGVAQSAKWLQRALGVTVDGHIGDHTLLAASNAHPDYLIQSVCDQRRKFLRALRTFPRFGRGWMRRVDDVENDALQMVHSTEVPAARRSDASPKAKPGDVDHPKIDPTTATVGTAATGGLAEITRQIQDALGPYADSLTYIKYLLIAVTCLGLGYTVYAFIKANHLKEV